MIKYIIFDLSEVLLTGIKETGAKLNVQLGLNPAEHNSPLFIPDIQEFFHGRISEGQYIETVLQAYPQLGSKEVLMRYIRTNFRQVQGTRDIIIKLKALGYKLALLSVHAREWVEYCDSKFDFHQFFDVISYSFADKVSKPDPHAFMLTLNKLQADPSECLFVDDSDINVEAAKQLGISAVLFTIAETLNKDLKMLLGNY